jgi:diacylglycerol O-acyltransferase
MGEREAFRAVDSAWLRMDRPGSTADIVSLLSFARRVPFDALRRLHEEKLLPFPRFSQRVAGADAVGMPAWERDPTFSLDRHLRHVELPERGPEAVRGLVADVASAPMDRERPLWSTVVADLPGGGTSMVTKVHHALGDGFALMSVLLGMADEPVSYGIPRKKKPSFRDVAFRDGITLDALRDEALRKLAAAGRDALDLARAIARQTALPSDPPTVLARLPTGVRRAGWTRALPLAGLKQAARGAGATVNDLVSTAIAGALRGALEALGEPVDRVGVRAMVPVNLRADLSGPAAGQTDNRFGLVYLELPVNLRTRAERLAAVRERVEVLKRSPDAIASYALLFGMGLLPSALNHLVGGFYSRKASLVLTNVPGPRQPLHLAGHRLGEWIFWVPHPSTLGLGISIMSYAGHLRVAVRADEAIVVDPVELAARIETELGELGVVAPEPPRRRRAAHAPAHAPEVRAGA